MKKLFTSLFLLAFISLQSQNCSIHPNTQIQIMGLGITWEKVYELKPDGKKVLAWAYQFDARGNCLKQVYRDQNPYHKEYKINKYGTNSDGSYVYTGFGMYDKDSNEVMLSEEESFYDFG